MSDAPLIQAELDAFRAEVQSWLDEDARRSEEVIKWAELRSTAAYASGRVVDDGIIDPRDTRAAVGMALSACHNNEVKGAEGYGVFRM